jgi:hypothetical protein
MHQLNFALRKEGSRDRYEKRKAVTNLNSAGFPGKELFQYYNENAERINVPGW